MMLCHWLLSFVLLTQDPDTEKYVSWLYEQLESPDPSVRKSASIALANEKHALPSVFLDFDSVSATARELRSALVLENGDSSLVSKSLFHLQDPNPKVRENLIRFLSKKELGYETLGERVAGLERSANEADLVLAEKAIEGLGNLDDVLSSQALLRCVLKSAHRELRKSALAALLKQNASTQVQIQLLPQISADADFLGPLWLSLASRARSEIVPALLKFRDHPDSRLRAAANQSFVQLQWELVQRQSWDMVEQNYLSWNRLPGREPDAIFDEISFHLQQTRRWERVEQLFEQIEQMLKDRSDRLGLFSLSRKWMFQGLVQLLRFQGAVAEGSFLQAATILDRIVFHLDETEEPELRYRVLLLLAKSDVLRAMNAILHENSSLPKSEDLLDHAYQVSLKTQEALDSWLSSVRDQEDSQWPYQVDEVFSDEFGLYPLLTGPVFKGLGPQPCEKVWRVVLGILSRNYPREFVGMEEDPRKPVALPSLNWRDPRTRRVPSLFAFRFAEFCSTILGKPEEAFAIYQVLAQRWRDRLNDFPYFATQVAQAEFRLGSVFMDRRDAEQSEKHYRAGITLLEDYERWAQARTGNREPDNRVQAMIANAYVSLAVNANVVKKRPEEARAHLEKAYSLDSSPFIRVLLSCYQARAGMKEDALRGLSQVDIEPNLYYNIACTYALLGERAKALQYLVLYFDYLQETPGEKKRSLDWARQDPDLDSLQEDAEFLQLLQRAQRRLQESGVK